LRSYDNGGIYFTRSLVNATENDENNLYYLADATIDAATWNTVTGNKKFDIVSTNVTNASADAFYYIDSNNGHTYLYVSGEKLVREYYDEASASLKKVEIAKKGFSGRKILYTVDNYLYTYNDSEKTLFRIDYTGEADDYNAILSSEEYSDVQILKIEFNTAWYAPEFFGDVLLYNDAQTVNGTSYNYIKAVNLKGESGTMTVAELKDLNEKYTEVTDYINALKGDKKLSAAVMTYFRTGSKAAVNAVVAEYGADALSENDLKEFNAYVERKLSERKPTATSQQPNDYTDMFVEDGKYYGVLSYFVGSIGAESKEDAEAMLNGWKATVYTETATETENGENGLAWWAWVLIALGGVAVVGGGVVLGLYLSKRSKKAMEERMRTSKPRVKIDTTDDKSIDVYADETAEETTEADTVEEAAEEVSEEETEDTAEEAVEETTEEVVETAVEETAPVAEVAEETPVAEVVEEAPVEAAPVEAAEEATEAPAEAAVEEATEAPAEESAEVTADTPAENE